MTNNMVPLLCLPSSISQMFLLRGPCDLDNNRLCAPPDNSCLPGTQVDVNHILFSSSFRLVSNTINITLSNASNVTAIITCKQQNDVSVGFGFYNVTGLVIDNINIIQCGGPIPSPDQANILYPNDRAFFFHEGQLVSLLVSYSCNIILFKL